jgi:class 3 adenylate cyclase
MVEPRRRERKIVTVLFCDLVGFTSQAEAMDPEDVEAMLRPYHDRVRTELERHGGTVEKFIGDAVMALFGAPVAHEDDPVRAVRAGLELVEVGRAYSREVEDRFGMEFAIRVGINTGTVVVGTVGTDLRYEYSAMGDAVNLASRMESHGVAGRVHVSETVARALGDAYALEDRGTIEVKGMGAMRTRQLEDLVAQPPALLYRARGIAHRSVRVLSHGGHPQ